MEFRILPTFFHFCFLVSDNIFQQLMLKFNKHYVLISCDWHKMFYHIKSVVFIISPCKQIWFILRKQFLTLSPLQSLSLLTRTALTRTPVRSSRTSSASPPASPPPVGPGLVVVRPLTPTPRKTWWKNRKTLKRKPLSLQSPVFPKPLSQSWSLKRCVWSFLSFSLCIGLQGCQDSGERTPLIASLIW